MKEHFNYASQPRAYADSEGYCLVELEANETIKDVREKYEGGGGWWEKQYSGHREVSSYKRYDKTFEGRLVLINTRSAYTG